MRFDFRSMAGLVLAASLSAVSADAQASDETGVEVYLPSAFEEFLPQSANDLVRRLPGFQVDEGDDVRGLSGAQGNVLINGRRPPPRSGSLDARLSSVRVEDVERLELIEAGARDIDMQGYPVLLNLVLRSGTSRRFNGRMEIEPRDNGGDETQLALGGSVSGSRFEAEGSIELYDEALISEQDVRSSTAGTPIARVTPDQDTSLSRREGQGSVRVPLGEGRSLTLSTAYDSEENSARPTREAVISGAALQETSAFEENETSFGVEFTSPLADRFELQAILTRTDGEEEGASTLVQDGVFSESTSGEETSETATRTTIRWRMSDRWAVEAGGTWALNTLDGTSSATIDGMVQDIDGSAASVEETRIAALAVASWTPRPDLSVNFGGRVEQFSLSSSNAGGDLTLTDFVPRADLTWTLDMGWVARVSAEREVGQLNLDLFLAETNLDNALNTAGAATLEPVREWTYRGELERRFGARGLVRLVAQRVEVDNPISRILTPDGDVTPANIGPETYDSLEGVFEFDFARIGLPDLFVEGIAVLRDSGRIDPQQGFQRNTSGHQDYSWELNLRQEFAEGKYVLGAVLERDAPSTHYWLTQIRREDRELEIRLNGEWRHSERWRTGFWWRLPMSVEEEREIYDGVRTPDTGPVIFNRIEREYGHFLSVWSEYEIQDEVHLRLNVRSGRGREGYTAVEDLGGGLLDEARVDIDNVPSFNIRLRWNL